MGVTGTFALSSPVSNDSAASVRFEFDFAADTAWDGWSVQLWESELAPEVLLPPELGAILAKKSGERSEAERQQVDAFRFVESPDQARRKQRIGELRQGISDLENGWPVTLVMEERDQPRPTFILKRGSYQQPTDPVSADTPACLPPFGSELPRNRLGLARWLMDPANPLPARVLVNRWWQLCFGTGLVRTSEDFGLQGEPPTHPELLDWLASEWIRSGWNVKHLLRLIVTSETYRRDSRTTPAARARDPENRYLSHGPRFRLSAEAIRDQALAASGLLVDRLGGPSVKPYHPPGLYEQVVAGSGPETYVMDHGASLYRRTLYTYWKRSVPNPGLLLFDRPFRETCTVRRARTSTPLQALNLLNDPTYVEAARQLAERMVREGGSTPEMRIGFGFRCLLARPARPAELAVLMAGWQRALKSFQKDPEAAAEWLRFGESRSALQIPSADLAAYATVASTLLNLDETVTKE
jgi:hypothetical protein